MRRGHAVRDAPGDSEPPLPSVAANHLQALCPAYSQTLDDLCQTPDADQTQVLPVHRPAPSGTCAWGALADVRQEPSQDALPVRPQMSPVRPTPDIPVVDVGRSVSGCFPEQVGVPDTLDEVPSAASLHVAVPAHLPLVPQAPQQSAPVPLPQPPQRLELAVGLQARLPQQVLLPPQQQQASQRPAALEEPMQQLATRPGVEQPLPRGQGDWQSQEPYRSAQVAAESEPHDAELGAQGARRQPVQRPLALVQASAAQPSAPTSPQPGAGSPVAQPLPQHAVEAQTSLPSPPASVQGSPLAHLPASRRATDRTWAWSRRVRLWAHYCGRRA